MIQNKKLPFSAMAEPTSHDPSPSELPPLLVGLSGASSSGKTTVARLLRDIFPNTIILHEDDFYLPEDQLPVKDGIVDWDSAGSLDIAALVEALKHLKATSEVPAGFVSKEDRNDVGDSGVSAETVARLRSEVRDFLDKQFADGRTRRLCIVDGFLLFGETVKAVRECFELRLMLRARYADAKKRREARSGYATIEGFWEDPPGYVDKIVWPAYVEEHAFLFEGGDVEGKVKEDVTQDLGIRIAPNAPCTVQQMLEWAISQINATLNAKLSQIQDK